jgi:hypothetical protein
MYYYTLPKNVNYYIVSKIGTGTSEDPIRPDIPEGYSFVGTDCSDGDYLIFTSTELPGKLSIPPQELETICNQKGINYEDVLKWKV